ncbi:MAG: YcjF family protein [Motiliproteus sp.]
MNKDNPGIHNEHTDEQVDPGHEPLIEKKKRTKGETFRPVADEILTGPPETIDASQSTMTTLDDVNPDSYTPFILSKKRTKGLKWFAALALSYVGVLLSYHTYNLAMQAWSTHWSLGGLFSAFVTGLVIASTVTLAAWFKDNDKLATVRALQHEAGRFRERRTHGHISTYLHQLSAFYATKPQAEAFVKMQDSLPDYADDAETLQHIDNLFVRQLDEKAYACISHYSSQTGIAVALSPWAAMDMLLTLWRNMAMIEEIAKIYGIRPTYPNKIKILIQVLNNMAFAGTSEMAIDYLASVSEQKIMSQLLGRMGQGFGSALISVRVGLSTVKECRPIPHQPDDIPKVRSFIKPMMGRLIAALKIKTSSKSNT